MLFDFKKWLIFGIFIIYCFHNISSNSSVPTTMVGNFSSSDSIKVVSYNIHYGISPKGHPALNNIISFLQSSNADIICLQEVDTSTFRSYFQKQQELLGKNLSMEYIYTPAQNIIPGQTGNMILSRFPIISSEEYILPSDRYQRNIQKVILATHLGNIAIFNTHLGLSKSIRKMQISEITKLLKETSEPFILAGDMNTSNLLELENFSSLSADTGKVMGQEKTPTFKSKKYESRIDYLLTSKYFTTQTYEVPSLSLSDHEPVVLNTSR